MPRGQRRGHRSQREATDRASVAERAADADGGDRQARTVIFTKTRMCKFHILGMCSKGSGCKFAHHKEELNPLPDLTRTKLCKTLISTGSCEDPDCQYAHNRDELRKMPDGLPHDAPAQGAQQFLEGHNNQPPPAAEAAFQQMFSGIQSVAMQWAQRQAAAQGPLAPGPTGWGTGILGQTYPQWLQQQAQVGNAIGLPAPMESKVLSLAAGLSLDEKGAQARAATEIPKDSASLELKLEARALPPSHEDANEPRIVVKNTFIDLEQEPRQTTCPRSSTWGAGLSALGRSDTQDSMPSLAEGDCSPQHNVVGGLVVPPPTGTPTGTSLSCVPERRRLFGGVRQFSEESETSTGTPPPTEKRHQDTPLGEDGRVFSQDSLSTLDEEEAEPEHAAHLDAKSHEADQSEAHFKIKNTFIELDDENNTPRPLRAVQTAMGRLDTMG